MKKNVLAGLLSLLSFSVVAQFSVRGVVLDNKTRSPLPGATVKIAERIYPANEKGEVEIADLPAGHYDVEIKFLGYKTRTKNLTLFQDEIQEFLLEEGAMFTDEVVILATRASETSPTTFTEVDKKEIRKQNFGQDLPMLLNWTPSVVTTSDAGAGVGYTGIRIRGSDATRVNVTINGIPYNDSESLGTFWVDVPDIASSSQSVQIQRGVGTSTNGAGAFGASINLQTNTRNDIPYAEAVNSFGSFNTRRHTVSFGTGLLNKHWVIDGRISRIFSDGFVDRASSDLNSYYFSSGYYADKTIVKAIVFGGGERTFQSWNGVPEAKLKGDREGLEEHYYNNLYTSYPTRADSINLFSSGDRTYNYYTYKNQVDDYKQDHYQLHLSHQFTDALTANASLHYTYGRGFYEEYKVKDSFSAYGLSDVTIGDSVITAADIIRRRWLDNDFYGVTYALNYSKEKLGATLGGAWNRYEGDHFGEIMWAEVNTIPTEYRYYFNIGDKRDFNIFLKTNYWISQKLSAFVDLQYRSISYKTYGKENKQNEFEVSTDFDFFNPKFGLTYLVNEKQQVYTSFSVANKEPLRDDFIATPGASPKHETLRNLEAGYRWSSQRLTLNANYYLMSYENQLVLTGALNDVGASLRTNVDKSYRTGVELDAAWRISNKLNAAFNLTISKNKINNYTEVLNDYGVNWDESLLVERNFKDTDISFSPTIISASSISYMPVNGVELSFLTKYVGKQYLDNTSASARSLDAYFINDLRIRYTWTSNLVKEVSVSVLANNMFNELYESNGYTFGYFGGGAEYRENFYYPQAGRNFMAMVSIKF